MQKGEGRDDYDLLLTYNNVNKTHKLHYPITTSNKEGTALGDGACLEAVAPQG